MTEITKIYWLHALTPLHVGEGFGIGAIDLPIVREHTTKWPLVPGSGIKGVIADKKGASDEKTRRETEKLRLAFGLVGNDLSNSGALVFTDARIVAIPVHSDYGTFAWVSSPRALLRLKRDLRAAGLGADLPEVSVEPNTLRTPAIPATELRAPGRDGRAYLSDVDFAVHTCPNTELWAKKLASWVFSDVAWRSEFAKRFAVIPDESFDFFAENGMEIAARIRIKPDTKTVADGGLWYEEYLPAESILAGLVWCDRVFQSGASITGKMLMDDFCKNEMLLQVGGKATIGKGRARCVFGGANA